MISFLTSFGSFLLNVLAIVCLLFIILIFVMAESRDWKYFSVANGIYVPIWLLVLVFLVGCTSLFVGWKVFGVVWLLAALFIPGLAAVFFFL